MCHVNMHTDYAMKKLAEIAKLDKRERGLFISRDCIITETYTGKTYKYKAYNYITGDSKYLGYKKRAINSDNYMELLSKVAEQSFYNIAYPTDGEELIDYIFATVFKTYGFKLRKEQLDLSKHIYRAMTNNRISLSDVAVGLGKTHAYLVASIVYHITFEPSWKDKLTVSKTIVISTSSKRLQQEIVRDYLPLISKMLLEHGIIDKEVKGVIRKGKENYICDIRLNNYIRSLKNKNPKEYQMLLDIMNSNIVDLSNVSIRNYDIERIKVIPKHCSSCPRDKTCRYRRMLRSLNTDAYLFQVTNHHYLIADAKKRLEGHKPLLCDYKAVIYDEAHKISDAFTSMVAVEIVKENVLELLRRMDSKESRSVGYKRLCKYIEETYRLIKDIFIIATADRDSDDEVKKYPIANPLILSRKLYELKELVKQVIIRIEDRKRNIQIAFEKLGDSLEIMLGDAILWIENPESDKTALCAIPRNTDEIISNTLFRTKSPRAMTSGTMAVNGDFNYIKRTLGIENNPHIDEIYKESPFDYYNNTILYQESELPYPNNKDKEYINQLANKIEKLIKASNGHALILFTSYKVMRKIYGLLISKDISYPIFQLSKGNGLAIKKYRKSKNGVLLGCGPIWEGFNFTGDILSHLIIVKLPFLVPDPITENLKKQFETEDEFRREILIPKMLTKLKQGYGRAIRNETDTAVISILDIRANERYREVIRQALPNCKVKYNIEDIKRFIQEKKSPEYFL